MQLKQWVIPPRCEHFTMASCEAPADLDLIFDPATRLEDQKQVLCASALVQTKEQEIPVRFVNVEAPVLIYKGTTLGSVQFSKPPHVCTVETVTKKAVTRQKLPTVAADKCSIEPPDPLENLDLSQSCLTSEEKDQLKQLLLEFQDIFAAGNQDLGCLPNVRHNIITGDAAPIHQRPYRTPWSLRPVLDEHVDSMLQAKVIRESSSPWGSPVVLAPKRDGSLRFCIDYRRLNAVTKKDTFPLPVISEVLDSLGRAKYFTNMDLMSGYWHVQMEESAIEKTAFVTYKGKYEFCRMPFGLCNGPSTFQRAMQTVLMGLEDNGALIYIDDCLVYSETFEQHLDKLRDVFVRFRKYGLKLKLKKCNFAMNSLHFLGHLVTAEGLKPDPKKVEAVAKMELPKNVKELQRFIGMASYYRRFIKDFAKIARPLFQLLRNDTEFKICQNVCNAIQELKDRLIKAPVLVYPDPRAEMVLETDASGYGLGVVLAQFDNESHKLRPIAYASRVICLRQK